MSPCAARVRADNGTWNSAATSAYPADLNLFIAEAILQRIIIRETALADEDKLDLAQLKPPPPVAEEMPDAPATPPPTPDVPSPADAAVTGQPEADVRMPEADGEAEAADAPSPARASPNKRRHRKTAADHFQRGLGAITLRPRPGQSRLARKPSNGEPTGHADAMRLDADGWGINGAEGIEIRNHEGNHSWSYVARGSMPASRKVVKLTWVFKVKRDGKKKARLCVQGCT